MSERKTNQFWETSKKPIIIGVIASLLFAVDMILAKFVWSNFGIERGFMWVAFVAWTISFGMNNGERLRMWIGHIVGFAAAVGMIYFGQLFEATFIGIGLAALIGVFVFNGLVMFFEHLKKFWLNSITGIFMGIFLTFSGLGVGLSPTNWGDAGLMIWIILLYSALGALCAWVSVRAINRFTQQS